MRKNNESERRVIVRTEYEDDILMKEINLRKLASINTDMSELRKIWTMNFPSF